VKEEGAHSSTSPHIQPPCVLCKKDGHPTNKFPSLPDLHNLIQLPRAPPPLIASSSIATISQNTSNKGLQTKFACAICSEYGHYTHHCPALPQFRQTLVAVHQSFQQNPSTSTSSSTQNTNIHYVTTSVNERMRFPCTLCESLDHFTYRCPMIIEYRHHQMALIQNATSPPVSAESMITPTPSPKVIHILSPEPEALSTPPWFLDDLYEDLPLNPPNSPIHFPTKILRPTTIFNPQYLDIWFMLSEPSQYPCITPPTPSSPNDNHTVKFIDVTLLDPLYS
jgi:hypothetical protein